MRIALCVMMCVLCGILPVWVGPVWADEDPRRVDVNPRIPQGVISLGKDPTSYVVVVDKTKAHLEVYTTVSGVITKVAFMPAATGEVLGQKQTQGDRKTPEGIYWPVRFWSREDIKAEYGQEVLFQYGVGAVALDYPNHMDRVFNRTGGGIWVHATDEESRLASKYDTRGCVVLSNTDYEGIRQFLELNQTPILIFKEVQYDDGRQTKAIKFKYQDFIRRWQETWVKKDLDRYVSFYHTDDFQSQGMNSQAWREYKNDIFKKYADIHVDIDFEDMKILEHDEYAYVQFKQRFWSDQFSDYGIKRLQLRKWPPSIVSEQFFAINDPQVNVKVAETTQAARQARVRKD